MVVNRARRAAATVAGAAALMLALSSCSLLEGPTPVTPERPPVEVPAEPATFVPGGTSEENLPFFGQVLREYAAGERPVQGQPIVDALVAGGFDKQTMQVSFDASKTGLAADSIYVAVRTGESCLIGQVSAEDRDATAEVVGAIGPDKNVCLIGQTRPIDW
ncbi:DUF6993 domain-containing protein [Leucobacter aridicollis]|uniref:DUF6993 domain-containing protein n=1 Tax=Leucobacter aridicollis TaxID=283878 RepID=UPI0037C9A997